MSLTRVGVILASAAFLGTALAQQNSSQQVEIVPVRGNIYLVAGAGGNITASVGPDGVLLVDSGLAQAGDRVIAAIRQFSQTLVSKAHLLHPAR